MKKILCFCFISVFFILSMSGCDKIKEIINDFSGDRDFDEIKEDVKEEVSKIEEKAKLSEKIDDWVEDTKENDEYVITVLGATGCSHCAAYKPIFDKIDEADTYENTEFYWFYLDELSEYENLIVTTTYNIDQYNNGFPFTFIVKNGKVLGQEVGYGTEEEIKEFFNQYLK